MAKGILRTFGEDDAQISAAETIWTDIPAACVLPGTAAISIREYKQLDALAASEHKSINDLVGQAMSQGLTDLLAGKPAGTPTTTP
jgi:hypothetical protein